MRWERLPEIWGAFSVLGLVFMWLEILLGYVPGALTKLLTMLCQFLSKSVCICFEYS